MEGAEEGAHVAIASRETWRAFLIKRGGVGFSGGASCAGREDRPRPALQRWRAVALSPPEPLKPSINRFGGFRLTDFDREGYDG